MSNTYESDGYYSDSDSDNEQSEIDKEDELIKCNEGNLVIDTSSAFYLFGTELDYVEEVFGSHFDIKNPNTKSACGCGESINFDMRV